MIMRKSKLYLIIYVLTLIMSIPFLLACSSTSALKEGQQLFTGLKPIEYSNYEKSGYAEPMPRINIEDNRLWGFKKVEKL